MAKKKQAPKRKQANPPKKQAAKKKVAPTVQATEWKRPLTFVLLITALCYLPSLFNGFVNWDDDVNILENPNLERTDAESFRNMFDLEKGAVIGNYNPLPIVTFGIEKMIAGELNPTLIHTTNLLLHLLTVFFVFKILLALGAGRWGSFVGGLLFGIHPMRVESVAWATERKDVLFAVFFFAALLYYIRWIRSEDKGKRQRFYLIMVVLALLSLFSKVQAVTLPLSMLAIDYLERRPINFKLIWEKMPFWLLSLLFGLINLYTLGQQGSTNDDVTNFNFVDRLCIGAYSFCVYLYKAVLPYPMSPLYPYPKPLPIWVYIAPIGFFGVAYLVYRWWKQDRRQLVFGFLFFFFNVVFLLQILGAGQGFLADRFTYVAYFGFFAIAAWYFNKFYNQEKNRTTVSYLTAGVFILYFIMSFFQIKVWKNGETLWTHVIKYEGKSNSLPYWNRGQYYRGEKNFEKSLADYTQAININPENPELRNSRGKTYFDMSMLPAFEPKAVELRNQALADYTAGLNLPMKKEENRAELLINRGAARASLNQLDSAIVDLTAGLEINPDNKNGYLNRSLVYFNMQNYPKAIEDYTNYLKYDPYNVNIWYERGMIRRSLGKNDEAIQDLSKAIELDPNFGIAYLERARAYAQKGDKSQAQLDYQRAAQFQHAMNEFDQRLMAQ